MSSGCNFFVTTRACGIANGFRLANFLLLDFALQEGTALSANVTWIDPEFDDIDCSAADKLYSFGSSRRRNLRFI